MAFIAVGPLTINRGGTNTVDVNTIVTAPIDEMLTLLRILKDAEA